MLRIMQLLLVLSLALMPCGAFAQGADKAKAASKAKQGQGAGGKAKKAKSPKKGAGKKAKAKAKPQAQNAQKGKKEKKGKKGAKGKKQAAKKPAEPEKKPEATAAEDTKEATSSDAEEVFATEEGKDTAADTADKDVTEEKMALEEEERTKEPAEEEKKKTEEEEKEGEGEPSADEEESEEDEETDEEDEDEGEDDEEGEAGEDVGPQGDEIPARHRITHAHVLLGRFNPWGLEYRGYFRYRFRLYKESAPLYKESHVGVGFTPTVNPTLARIGATLYIQPLTIVTVSAGYYFNVWFSTFGHLQSFDTATAYHSDSRIDELNDGMQPGYGTTGHEVQIGLNLKGKVGPVVMRSDTNVHLNMMDLREGDVVYYDPRQDVLIPNKGWLLTSDLDVLYAFQFPLYVGLRATLRHAFYRDKDYLTGEPKDNMNTPFLRLGPAAAYTIFDKPGKMYFNKPTVFLTVAWWILHRFRTGKDDATGGDVSQAVPFVALGFQFEADLFQKD